jgi:hypothetical protein
MIKKLVAAASCSWLLGYSQTQIDLSRQVRGALPYASGGTNATSRAAARANVGTPKLVATDFPGSDIAAQIANAFASFGAGKCGVVVIPQGSYTYSTTIYVPGACTLEGLGLHPGATSLKYSGPPATAAVALLNGPGDNVGSSYATLRNLHIEDVNSSLCPNNGMLAWNTGAAGTNKWQCYDGSAYTAPTAHLAGIVYGSIDPTAVPGGIQNLLENIDIDGDAGAVFPNQGGFHFGLFLNGCQECTINSVRVQQADDGFYVGGSTNGVLFNQVTARQNRRAGFHYRGPNLFQCNSCLFESNQWFGHTADPAQNGAGIRISSENQGAGPGRGVKFINTYFEANTVDVMVPPGDTGYIEVDNFQSIRGQFGASRWTQTRGASSCVIPDASLVSILPGTVIINGCLTTGTFNQPGSGQNSVVLFTDSFGIWVNKIIAAGSGGNVFPYYELPNSEIDRYLHLRTDNIDEGGLKLENFTPAASCCNNNSAAIKMTGTRWTGTASASFNWTMMASAQTPNGGSDSTHGVYLSSDTGRQFGFRDKGVLQLAGELEAQTAPPLVAVQPAAGTSATCTANASSSNMAGQISLRTGTGAWASGGQCKVTFPLSGAPALSLYWMVLTPADAGTAAAMNSRQVYVTNSGFDGSATVNFGVADTAQTNYSWNYFAIRSY